MVFILILSSCATGEYDPQVVVDTSKVENLEQYKIDKAQCTKLASTIDLNTEAASKALAGGAAGGLAVAGVATAVAGAVFLPALPFIAAGTAADFRDFFTRRDGVCMWAQACLLVCACWFNRCNSCC